MDLKRVDELLDVLAHENKHKRNKASIVAMLGLFRLAVIDWNQVLEHHGEISKQLTILNKRLKDGDYSR